MKGRKRKMIDSEFDRVIRGENNYKTNKKGKWKIVLIIIILIIIAGGAVLGYSYYSGYKTAMPKIKFFEYINKTNIEQIIDISLLKSINDKMNESNSYTLNNNISISTGEEDVLSKINAKINYYKDNQKQLNKADIIINNDNDEVIKVTGLADNENIGIKSDEIVVKYIGSKFKNLNNLFNNLEVQENEENLEEKIVFPNKEMLNVYKEILNSKLLDEQFRIEKNVKLTEGNSSVETTVYSLSFDKQEILQIITELQDTLINDDELINCLITGKIKEQSEEEIYFSGVSPTDALNLVSGYKIDVTADKVKEEIENNFTKLFEYLNGIENLKFNFDIYVNGSKVVKEVIKLENILELNLDFKTISENENYAKATLLLEDEETGDKNGCSLSLNRKNNNVTTNFISEICLIEKGQINNKIIFEVNLEGNSSSTNVNNNTTITYSDTESEYVLKINSKLEYALNEDIEKLNSENCLFLDELDAPTREAVLLSIATKAEEVFYNKFNSIINPMEEIYDQNSQIIDIDGETEEEIAQKKESAKNKLINAVKEEMKKAQEEEREYALIDLQELKIEGTTVSVMVNENMAVIAVDGFTFYIDPNFNLTEE